jgi:hypothetical protein
MTGVSKMEVTKHHVTDINIRKRKYSDFNVVRITIVSQKNGKAPEEIELTLHTNAKFPKITTGKIEYIA